MTLPADTAAILRAALHEAEHLSGFNDRKAFMVLAEAVGNLLPAEEDRGVCYCGSPESSHRLGNVEHSYQRRPEPGDPVRTAPTDEELSELPF